MSPKSQPIGTALHIGTVDRKRFEIPRQGVTQKNAFLGTTGSGKTYGAMVLAEEMFRIGAQFVALDPVGIWWGLRLSSDGVSPGLDIPVFGGLKGDIPLTPTSGALMAELVVERRLTCVIDYSQFETDGQKARFAADFAERFFFLKKASPSPVHLFLEECQELVPQNVTKGSNNVGENVMLSRWNRVAKLGRNFGIGLSLISQRPQEVNKKTLNLCEVLFAFGMRGTQERRTVEEWLEANESGVDARETLKGLKTGVAIVSSPRWLEFEGIVHIGQKRTFDSSKTPDFDDEDDTPAAAELAPLDVDEIRTAMAATIEEAAANDPSALKKENAALRRELHARGEAAPPEGWLSPEAAIALAEKHAFDAVTAAIGALRTDAREPLERLKHVLANGWEPPKGAPPEPRTAARPAPRPAPSRTPKSVARVSRGPGVALPDGEQKVLTAIAQYGEATREQVSILTGYKRSTRDTYIQRLGTKGYVQPTAGGVEVTQEGIDALGSEYEPLPTGKALREYWLTRLPEGERKCLEVLIDEHPGAVDREAVSKATGYKRSTRDTYLQRLGTRRLVVTEGRGLVRASDELFS